MMSGVLVPTTQAPTQVPTLQSVKRKGKLMKLSNSKRCKIVNEARSWAPILSGARELIKVGNSLLLHNIRIVRSEQGH
jgi:hypothetical protein